MFTRIFVPLDGSSRAERALPVAARLAQVSHGTVILASVVTPALNYSPALVAPVTSPELVDEDVRSAKAYLARVQKDDLLTGVETEIVTGVSLPASIELIDLARTTHADLIVMCSHGRTGLMHWALGSVAQQVVRSSPIPVLVLKANGPIPSGPEGDALSILVPLDGSPLAEDAIEPAAQLAAALSAPGHGSVKLLEVIRYPLMPVAPFQPVDPYVTREDPAERGSLQEGASTYLHSVARRFAEPPLAALNLRVGTTVVFAEDVAGAIGAVADGAEGLGKACDVVAMATHGRSGFQRLALGSIAERTLQATKRPLLVVRPPVVAHDAKPAASSTRTAAHDPAPALPLF